MGTSRILAAVVVGLVVSRAEAQWTVVRLHPAGATTSDGYGVGTGQQVGYVKVGPTVGHSRASVWSGTAASWVNLHPAGPDYSVAYGADGGQQVGEVITGGISHASLWTGSAASWVDLHPAGFHHSIAWGAGGGQQVGLVNDFVDRAAMWSGSAGSLVVLNPPPVASMEFTSLAYATDGAHQVGYVELEGSPKAALWSGTAVSWVNLHPAGMISSWGYGVQGSRQVGIVRVADSSSHAALWSGSAASWVDLHIAGALNSRASDVQGNQQVGYVVLPSGQHASLWTGSAASWVDLHAFLPNGFVVSEARSITTDGVNTFIVGWGYSNLVGHEEALMWVGAGPAFCAGDFNGDGAVTSADVPGFVAVLLGGGACPAPPAGCLGDFNLDGVVDGADVAGFVAKVAAGGTCP